MLPPRSRKFCPRASPPRRAARQSDESLWMLKTLGFAVPVFYGVYYAIAAVLSAAFGAAFDGTEPFDLHLPRIEDAAHRG